MDIEAATQRYNLDEEMKAAVTAFDQFIWQNCMIGSVEQLVEFEREYQHHDRGLGMVYDNELSCFGDVDMENGPMSLLSYGSFQDLAEGFEEDIINNKFLTAGLTDLETIEIRSMRADISIMYRPDVYYGNIPPFVLRICDILNSALSKLPVYTQWVVRACKDHDKADFQVGDVFTPGYSLTTSADVDNWKDDSAYRYRIKPLDEATTKARAMFLIDDTPEKQVNFLQDASFRIVEVNDWGEGKKEFVMEGY